MTLTSNTATKQLGDEIRKEPAFIVDKTGSMQEMVSPTSGMSKWELATRVAEGLVNGLAEHDSQGADEKGGGGLLTYAFSDGECVEVGDLNPSNFRDSWRKLHPNGGTYIMPAFEAATEAFNEEFGHLAADIQPKLLLAVLTDGALHDLRKATGWLEKAGGNLYVYVIVVGYGEDHDAALAQWRDIDAGSVHLTVKAMTASDDSAEIVREILAQIQ